MSYSFTHAKFDYHFIGQLCHFLKVILSTCKCGGMVDQELTTHAHMCDGMKYP